MWIYFSRAFACDLIYSSTIETPILKATFLESLENLILDDKLKEINPAIVKDFVFHYESKGRLKVRFLYLFYGKPQKKVIFLFKKKRREKLNFIILFKFYSFFSFIQIILFKIKHFQTLL